MLTIGTKNLENFKIGGKQGEAIYLGDKLVWSYGWTPYVEFRVNIDSQLPFIIPFQNYRATGGVRADFIPVVNGQKQAAVSLNSQTIHAIYGLSVGENVIRLYPVDKNFYAGFLRGMGNGYNNDRGRANSLSFEVGNLQRDYFVSPTNHTLAHGGCVSHMFAGADNLVGIYDSFDQDSQIITIENGFGESMFKGTNITKLPDGARLPSFLSCYYSFLESFLEGCSNIVGLPSTFVIPESVSSVGNDFLKNFAKDTGLDYDEPSFEFKLPDITSGTSYAEDMLKGAPLAMIYGDTPSKGEILNIYATDTPGIDPDQEFDMVHTLTFNTNSGNCKIGTVAGGIDLAAGSMWYRAGTSGPWQMASIGRQMGQFPITNTVMQVGHDFNKDSNDNYQCPTFRGETKLVSISITQKEFISGIIGEKFMYRYAYGCTNLVELDVPKLKDVTKVKENFMNGYANSCLNLKSLSAPNLKGITNIGRNFMNYYAILCENLTLLGVPNISTATEIGEYFMNGYAEGCESLTSLDAPDLGLVTEIPSSFMGQYANGCKSLMSLGVPNIGSVETIEDNFMNYYAYNCISLTSLDAPDFSSVTQVGDYVLDNYANGCTNIETLYIPDTQSVVSTGIVFMNGYAAFCDSLTNLILPSVGYFENNIFDWLVPSSRLGILKGKVINSSDLQGWKDLTVSWKVLYHNNIQDPNDVILL